LILKPKVGLTDKMSSPLSFLRIVVLPALSRPLAPGKRLLNMASRPSSQKKDPHFFFLLAILADDC
jgi:hypothetical protein